MARKKKSTPSASLRLPAGYPAFLESLKGRIRQAQTTAMHSVNLELIRLYWDIGRLLVERQRQDGWGKSTVDRLAGDLPIRVDREQAYWPGSQRLNRRALHCQPRKADLRQAFEPDSSAVSNVSVGQQANTLAPDRTRAHAVGWVPATWFDGRIAVRLESLTYPFRQLVQ
jgi:DUF1016 N-terminal domain